MDDYFFFIHETEFFSINVKGCKDSFVIFDFFFLFGCNAQIDFSHAI